MLQAIITAQCMQCIQYAFFFVSISWLLRFRAFFLLFSAVMVYTCVVYGCSKRSEPYIRTLHEFPRDSSGKNAWKRFVNRTRAGWRGPSAHSRLCSDHFTTSCYRNWMPWSMKINSKLELIEGSIPSVYPEGTCGTLSSPATTSKNMDVVGVPMPSAARRVHVGLPVPVSHGDGHDHACHDGCGDSSTSLGPSSTIMLSPPAATDIVAHPHHDLPQLTPSIPKKRPRSAARKREINRILESYAADACQDEQEADFPVEPLSPPRPVSSSHEDCSLGLVTKPLTRTVGTQYERPPGTLRSVKCGVNFTNRKRPPHRSKGTQVEVATRSQGANCRIIKPAKAEEDEETDMITDDDDDDEADDMDVSMYEPGDDEEDEEEENSELNTLSLSGCQEKFLVYKTSLWELFQECPICRKTCSVEEKYRKGTKVVIRQECPNCDFQKEWSSQPSYGDIPAGNIELSGAILFTGASPTKVLRVLKTMNVVTTCLSTFNNHLSRFLVPTVLSTWKEEQEQLFKKLKEMEGGLVLGGDARSDSPGHSAKYGSYTIMEERLNKVIHQELIQSNEVANSGAMEKEGLIRAVTKLHSADLEIDTIITDRHPQIQKWLRENLPETKHYYDVWHVAKGFTKKVEKLGKQAGCEDVRGWTQSISNHMCWAPSSTPDGNQDMILAKWLSLSNHIQNIHEGHDSDLFPECVRGEIEESGRKKKWLKPSTKACEKLTALISNTRLKNDVKKLSPLHQTSSVEAFHSLILKFCPKNTVYSFMGMYCRLTLAAIHQNENSERPHAKNKDGEEAIKITFPKYKNKKEGCARYSIQRKKVAATYGYLSRLMKRLCESVVVHPDNYSRFVEEITVPPPLSSQFVRPTREEAMAHYSKRFNVP